uniref:Putative reverse transcriptase n=1 Tax=Ixodes ricinus TaxID=34613 RepID=A0A147BMT3_IXORI
MFTFKSLHLDYGRSTAQLAKRYVNVTRSISVFKTHLDFTKTCRDMRVIPQSLRLKRLVHTQEGHRIVAQAEHRLLNARIHECHTTIKKKELDLFFLRRKLEHQIPDVLPPLQLFAGNVAATAENKQRSSQQRKLSILSKSSTTNKGSDTTAFVMNLSSRRLSDCETDVLAKGHNFNMTSGRPPLPKMVAAVEDGISHLDTDVREGVRLKAIGILSRLSSRPHHNLPKEESKALRELQADTTIVILPADKGNSTVVLDREAYEHKVGDLLDSPAYEKLKKDPTRQVQDGLNKTLADVFRNHPDSKGLYFQLICRNGSAPGFYGLPKIHKINVPLRPIVDFTTSPLRALSNYLHRIISPLTGTTSTYVRNAGDFVERMSEVKVNSEHSMVSFDVVSLFTSVPVPLAVSTARAVLESDSELSTRTSLSVDELCRLLDFCLRSTYFCFKGDFYKQTSGTAMGASISVTTANLTMESIEQRALQSFTNRPEVFVRYVDDCFCILKTSEVDRFLAHLNSIEPDIQFTVEREKDSTLPFLDVLVKRQGEEMKFSVYRKPTHTGRYLNFKSNHPTSHKASVVATLMSRAAVICSSETDRKSEEQSVIADLRKNGYPTRFIQQVTKRTVHARQNPQPKGAAPHRPITRISVPYVPGTSETLSRLLAKQGIHVAH